MTRRSPRSIRRLDIAKSAVILLLAIAAIVLIATFSYEQQQQRLVVAVNATLVPTFTAEPPIARPILLSPLTGQLLEAGAIVLTGSAQPGYTVQALVDGQIAGRTLSSADGSWSLITRSDTPGERTLQVQVLDDIGRVVATTEPMTVALASVTMQAPALDASMLSSALTAGVIRLTGSGEPGTQVQIVVDGKPLGIALVDDAGRWSLTADVRAPGSYAFGLTTVDKNGRVVATATPVRLVVSAPSAPLVALAPTVTPVPATPTPSATPLPAAAVESFVVSSQATGSSVELTGSGSQGSEVQVTVNQTVVATGTVGTDGRWVITATLDTPDAYQVGVQARTGLTSAIETLVVPMAAVVVAVPEATPTLRPTDTPVPTATSTETNTPVPTDTATATSTTTETATATVPPSPTPSPTEPATSTATSTATPVAPELDTAAITSAAILPGPAVISGTGDPGTIVQVTVNGETAGITVAGPDGRWRQVVVVAEAGTYTVGAQTIDREGQILAESAPVDIVVVPPTPTPAPTHTREPTATSTSTATETSTATSTPRPTATATPVPTATSTSVPTATSTSTATETSTATSTPRPTATATSSLSADSTAVSASVATKVLTAKPTRRTDATAAPVSTVTPTPLPTATSTSTATLAVVATSTLRPTATTAQPATPSPVPTTTSTSTATQVAAAVSTSGPKATATSTATIAPTAASTATTAGPQETQTVVVPTALVSETAAVTPTSVVTPTAVTIIPPRDTPEAAATEISETPQVAEVITSTADSGDVTSTPATATSQAVEAKVDQLPPTGGEIQGGSGVPFAVAGIVFLLFGGDFVRQRVRRRRVRR